MTDIEIIIWLAFCGLFVLLSALYSGMETGVYCVNRLRLRVAAQSQPAARRMQGLLGDQPGLLSAVLLGNNLANYLAPVCLATVFLSVYADASTSERGHRAELYTTLILTPVLFILGEVVPKNVFQSRADHLMPRLALLLGVSYRLFRATGVIRLQKFIADFIARRLQREPAPEAVIHSRHGMYQMLREGAASGALSQTQAVMLERIHNLESIRVGSVMVPRSRTVMLDENAARADAEAAVRRTTFSRMPVYRGESRRVVGVVHVLDVLAAEPGTPLSRMMLAPVVVSPATPVIEALSILQRQRRRMAVVVDNGGHCLGLVTVKDLVEEVVGELAAW
jgi:CBS domain containing-hemolysin-like protein